MPIFGLLCAAEIVEDSRFGYEMFASDFSCQK